MRIIDEMVFSVASVQPFSSGRIVRNPLLLAILFLLRCCLKGRLHSFVFSDFPPQFTFTTAQGKAMGSYY